MDPMRTGTIDAEGVVPLLTELESLRVTGLLRFEGLRKGEVRLVAGQVSAEQDERGDGVDVIDVLLEERDAQYEVFQRLPPLPVSGGDHTSREGSLTVHVPADLMNYCEGAGLTGLLTLESDGRRAEVGYEAGELGAIRLEGVDELHEAFGWEDGRFWIRADNRAPQLDEDVVAADDSMDDTTPFVRPVADTTGKHFLRVVEVTLADIVKEREERRPASRTSPPLPEAPPKKAHASLPPPKKRQVREDQTVRVIYLGGQDSRKAGSPSVRPPSGVRAPSVRPPAKKAKRTHSSEAKEANVAEAEHTEQNEPSGLSTWIWALVLVVIALASLFLLAALPPLE
ncbi:MAG: hypothetical protein AAF411_05975 [Myxococcota bacterium]